ncbi:MAG TPA: hypothetical protein VMF50_18875 [Candidatus Binataceae bacterium]|nr:hypothetical protein [Candidatus Binataceae bacterium]
MPRQPESNAKELSTLLIVTVGVCLFGLFSDGNLLTRDTGHDPNMTAKAPQAAPPGISQSDWDKQLEICKEVGAEIVRRQKLTSDQLVGLPNIGSEVHMCMRMSAPIENQYQPLQPIYVDPIPAVPIASPTPPSTIN